MLGNNQSIESEWVVVGRKGKKSQGEDDSLTLAGTLSSKGVLSVAVTAAPPEALVLFGVVVCWMSSGDAAGVVGTVGISEEGSLGKAMLGARIDAGRELMVISALQIGHY